MTMNTAGLYNKLQNSIAKTSTARGGYMHVPKSQKKSKKRGVQHTILRRKGKIVSRQPIKQED